MTNIPPIPAKLEDGRLLPSMEGNLKPNLENGDYSDNNVGNKRNSVIGVDGFDGEYTAPGNPLDSFTPQVRIAAQALLDLIADDESSEVLMNGPNEIGRKVKGARYHCPNIFFDNAETYHDESNLTIRGYER
jgi:hypothetical protein